MKIFQNRAVAWVVLVLAVIGSVCIGLARKDSFLAKEPTKLPEVRYQQWIRDDAELLSEETEKTVRDYNTAWNEKYYAVVAVATIDHLTGWKGQEFAASLGKKWGLGQNDMILVLVKDGDWQVYRGDSVGDYMTDTQQQKLKLAIETPYYAGDFDGAVTAFFRQADVFYGQMAQQYGGGYNGGGDTGWTARPSAAEVGGGVSLGGVILLIAAIFVVWVLLDRMRYDRYRRRYGGGAAIGVVGAVPYYPVFWGRALRPRAPRPPRPPRQQYGVPRPPTGGYRPSGGYRPPRSTPHHSKPRSGGFGGGGFGGSRGGRGGFGGGGFGGGKR